MVNQKWLAISYCFAFISVYFVSLAYAGSITVINQLANDTVIPISANTTLGVNAIAMNSVSSFSGLGMIPIILIIILLVLILIRLTTGAMARAM